MTNVAPTTVSGAAASSVAKIAPVANCQLLLFAVLLVLIMCISVHDAALVVLNRGVIAEMEQNPLGRWLITVNRGEVWLLVAVKLAGTAAAGAVLIEIYRLSRRNAWIAVTVVAALQVSLLAYLCLV